MAISDQDRQIAEDTFGLIERSTAGGNSFEASQPAVTPEPDRDYGLMVTPSPRMRYEVSMALAEHTQPALDVIEQAGRDEHLCYCMGGVGGHAYHGTAR